MDRHFLHECGGLRGRKRYRAPDDVRVGASILIAAAILAIALLVAVRGLWLLLGLG